jgi:hypothetical protein
VTIRVLLILVFAHGPTLVGLHRCKAPDPLFKNSLANVQLSAKQQGASIPWSELAEVSVLARDLLLTNTVGGSPLGSCAGQVGLTANAGARVPESATDKRRESLGFEVMDSGAGSDGAYRPLVEKEHRTSNINQQSNQKPLFAIQELPLSSTSLYQQTCLSLSTSGSPSHLRMPRSSSQR